MAQGKFDDKRGRRFGRLVAIEHLGYGRWLCKCDCGNDTVVSSGNLNKAHILSCGCLRKELNGSFNIKHGGADSRLYGVWRSMKQRCTYVKNADYKNYGGRGITVCDEWMHDFSAFRGWALSNGYDEDATLGECTLDRIDNNGNYEPSNCRWVPMSVQAVNKRKFRIPSRWKPVEQLDENGNPIRRFNCIADASVATGVRDSGISQVCRGKAKTAMGTRWRYAQPLVQTKE